MQNPPQHWFGSLLENMLQKSIENLPKTCSGVPKGVMNPPKILPKTLLERSLDLLWWSKFGLESPEEAHGGSKRPQGGPRRPKRSQNQLKLMPNCIKV